jgi:cytochrome P450
MRSQLGKESMRLPPGPRGTAQSQAIKDFKRDGLSFFTRVAREYGDVTSWHMGLSQHFLVSHPDRVKEVLVTHHQRYMKASASQEAKIVMGNALLNTDGELHRRHRRMIQPIMHHQRIAAYGEVMAEYAARTRDRWTNGQTVNMHSEMLRLTLHVVTKCLFDVDLEEAGQHQLHEAVNAATRMFSREAPAVFLAKHSEVTEALRNIWVSIHGIIDERRRTGEDRGDLLSMLLAATDPEGGTGMLTDQEVFDHTIGLIVAGHETTAGALTWSWYLLSEHPEAEQKLLAELDEVLGGRLPTIEDVPRLRFTQMVFKEALRLYPSAWAQSRRALVDHEIDGYTVPAGSTVYVSQWVTHRDPRWFAEPERFWPERWEGDDQADTPRYAYFPFGGGVRLCIGEPFAELEAAVVLATLAPRWHMTLAPGHQAQPAALITLRPKGGMPMAVGERR